VSFGVVDLLLVEKFSKHAVPSWFISRFEETAVVKPVADKGLGVRGTTFLIATY
jgi:hypothetical protein